MTEADALFYVAVSKELNTRLYLPSDTKNVCPAFFYASSVWARRFISSAFASPSENAVAAPAAQASKSA